MSGPARGRVCLAESPEQAEKHRDGKLDAGDLKRVIDDGMKGDTQQGGSGREEENLV